MKNLNVSVDEVCVKEIKKLVALDNFEQRVIIEALADRRNDLISEEKSTDDLNLVILKVIEAPEKKVKRNDDYER